MLIVHRLDGLDVFRLAATPFTSGVEFRLTWDRHGLVGWTAFQITTNIHERHQPPQISFREIRVCKISGWKLILTLSIFCPYNMRMEIVGFEWDDVKADINAHKHGVTFEEAETVFSDPLSRVIEDPDHSSYDEDRFIILGMSALSRLLVVCHCYRTANNTIRIISARKATRHESGPYAGKGR